MPELHVAEPATPRKGASLPSHAADVGGEHREPAFGATFRARAGTYRFSANRTQHALSAEVTVTRVTSGASEVYRSDRVIAEHPRDDLIVSLHRAGTGTVTQHARRARLRAGSAAMYDAASPYTLSFPTPIRETVLQLPRRAIRPLAARGTSGARSARPDGSACLGAGQARHM